MELCPCGSSLAYNDCCGPLHARERPALTAEQLMRSRYSAYVKADVDYITATTSPESRTALDHKATRNWAEKTRWLGLQIVSTSGGGEGDTEGKVEFIASYQDASLQRLKHHETGRFTRVDGAWYYEDGEFPPQEQVVREEPKVGRNAPCPCGSGKKFKKCCVAN